MERLARLLSAVSDWHVRPRARDPDGEWVDMERVWRVACLGITPLSSSLRKVLHIVQHTSRQNQIHLSCLSLLSIFHSRLGFPSIPF